MLLLPDSSIVDTLVKLTFSKCFMYFFPTLRSGIESGFFRYDTTGRAHLWLKELKKLLGEFNIAQRNLYPAVKALWDVSFAIETRVITSIEQNIHGFLERMH
jgi:hypothetical protein